MKIETYNTAKRIIEEIHKVESQQDGIKKLKARDDDAEFTSLVSDHYSLLEYHKEDLQRKFDKL